MRVKTFGYGLLVVVLVLAACGGNDFSGGDGGSGGSQNIPLEGVVGEVVKLQCDAIDQCAGELFSVHLQGMDCETYFGRMFEDSDWPNIEDAVKQGRAAYHGDKARACFDAWAALGCQLFTTRAPDLCEDALEGTVRPGGDCEHNVECQGALFCKIDGACPGKCAERLAAGSPCTHDDSCQNGLVCDGELHTCVTPAGAEQPCGAGKPACGMGLFCVGRNDSTPGTCKKASDILALHEGAPCEFEGTWCKAGLSCVLEAWTAAGPQATCKPVVGSGTACGLGIPNQCPTSDYCNADPQSGGSFEGVCVPLPADGAPCAAREIPPRCAPYHICAASGRCQQMQRLGGACATDTECYSNNCDGSTCSPEAYCPEP